jgi:uncharacterized MAPEG superfamily protein
MVWVDLVTALAVLQFFWFAYLVGKARVRLGIAAPAITGHPEFERYFRVQQNTLETLIMFLPALWIAGHYWNAAWMALIGIVYLIGRVLYLFGYVRDPHSRSWGYALSMAPVGVLILFGLVGIARAIYNS